MRAVEFSAKLKNNRIQIPKKLPKQVSTSKNGTVKVIVLIEEHDKKDENDFHRHAAKQFLKGYAKTDSVYDHY